jgi:hypothetical protein
VRGVLGSPNKRLATLACVALLELRDHEAVPDLMVMLGDRDANLRARAHAALVGLTGFDLGRASGPWIRWLDESFAWWDGRAPECRVAILSGTPEECARALRETAEQRLFADEVARMLALGLQRPEPDLFASACRALAGLPEHDARVALRRGATRAEPDLARHALAALQRQDERLARTARPERERHGHAMPRMRTR